MASEQIDFNDAVVSPAFVLSAAVAVGLIDFTLFGFDFSKPLITLGSGTAISVAKAISGVAIAVVYATNKPDFSGMGMVETYVALATIGLVIAPPFSPVIQNFLTGTIPAIVAITVQAAGFYTLSYLG